MAILSPSLLSANFYNLEADFLILKKCGITNLHIDVMDGDYVPSISFGMPVIASIRKKTDFIFDVHMMVTEADRYVEAMKEAGADIITVHYEAIKHLDRAVNHIKALGIKAFVSLNPATPIAVLENILPLIDGVLIMSVNPGFGGQSYIPYCTQKIKDLDRIRRERKLDFQIQVDGGINSDTIKTVLEAGADNIVAGSAVFNGDIEKNINQLKSFFS